MVYVGVSRLNCCGWKEISSLRGYQAGGLKVAVQSLVLKEAASNYGARCGAFLFTANSVRAKYAKAFAADIEKAKLGKVTKLKVFTNPNTGHQIQTFVWFVDQKRLGTYVKQHKLGGVARYF